MERENKDTPVGNETYFAAPKNKVAMASGLIPFSAALEQCLRFDAAAFFANRREKWVEMKNKAFVLFQALQAGGDAAFDLAVACIPPGLRQRAPSRGKLELLAVQLTAKPTTTEERKGCSAYASLLVVAQARGITSEDNRE